MKMKNLNWLVVTLAATGLMMIGCGDDDTGGTDTDIGTDTSTGDTSVDAPPVTVPCPPEAPDGDGLMGACCYRKAQDDPAEVELRLAGIKINSPSTLGNVVVRGLLNDALDTETFNWLMKVEGGAADGDITVQTGYGDRQADTTFSFASGIAPMPGAADRWDPVTIDGTISGETVSTPVATGRFTVPILDEDDNPTIELPLNSPELNNLTLSENRSCVGARTGTVYSTMDGEITMFIRVDDADAVMLDVSVISTSLCNFIRGGDSTEMASCTTFPQDTWTVKPDAICDDAGVCDNADGACDPDTTCNAWTLNANFAAHGVEIN